MSILFGEGPLCLCTTSVTLLESAFNRDNTACKADPFGKFPVWQILLSSVCDSCDKYQVYRPRPPPVAFDTTFIMTLKLRVTTSSSTLDSTRTVSFRLKLILIVS